MPDNFRVLFIGDIVGRPGRRALSRFLPELKNKYRPSLVIANGENAAGGIGLTEEIARELLLQVDVLTSGNHIWDKKRFSIIWRKSRDLFGQPIIRKEILAMAIIFLRMKME